MMDLLSKESLASCWIGTSLEFFVRVALSKVSDLDFLSTIERVS